MYALIALAISFFLKQLHDITWVGFGLTFLCVYVLIHTTVELILLIVELVVQKVKELWGDDDDDKL